MLARWHVRTAVAALSIVALAAVGVACSSSPTSPDMDQMRLTEARLMLLGQTVNGTTMGVGHGDGSPMRFEARLMGPAGPVVGQQVTVRYRQPGMMMGSVREFHLYDDGTHGDEQAGDGLYCFEDVQFEYACNAQGMGAGTYHYEFFGMDHEGHHSNHVDVTVTLE